MKVVRINVIVGNMGTCTSTAKNTVTETLDALGATSRVWKVALRHFVWIVRKISGRRWKEL